MKKIIKRILAGALLMAVVTVSGLITIIFFPQPLFANKVECKQFRIYSDQEINKDIEIVLNDAMDLVKRSELLDPTYTFDIFLSHNTIYNGIDDILLGRGPTARTVDNNVIIKVAIDPARDLAFPTFYENCEVNLTYIIAHEMIHCLQENRYGKLKFNPFRHPEYWKLEGYPEYIARQLKLSAKEYALASEIERYIEVESTSTDGWISSDEGGCKAPVYYYKSRLMTEYLMDIKNFSYDDILKDTVSEDAIYAAMIRWKESQI